MITSNFRVYSVSLSPQQDVMIRRCTRVLAMVHELHKVGYQRIRIAPFIHDIGTWRCPVTFDRNINQDEGTVLDWDFELAPQYSSAAGDEYFDWKDAAGLNARQLAQLFIERFPEIIDKGRGQDWAYTGWFTSVLGLVESSGALPILRGNTSHPQLVVVPIPPVVLESS